MSDEEDKDKPYRDPYDKWSWLFKPLFSVMGYSMMLGQWMTGDKSTGAFPTGLFGSCFGCMFVVSVPVVICILLVNAGVWQ